MHLDEALPPAEAERVMRWMVGNYGAHDYSGIEVVDGELSFIWRKYEDPEADPPVLLESDKVSVSVEQALSEVPAASPKKVKKAKTKAKAKK